MTEFSVFVSANYRAEENHTVLIEARNKDEAEEIAQKLADNGKFIGDHEWLAHYSNGFQIFEAIDDVVYTV